MDDTLEPKEVKPNSKHHKSSSRKGRHIYRDCESTDSFTNVNLPTTSQKQTPHPNQTLKTPTSSDIRNKNQHVGMYSRDWRSALLTPPTYRIGNRTLRFNYYFAILLAGVIGGVLVLLFYVSRTQSPRIFLLRSSYADDINNNTTQQINNNINNKNEHLAQILYDKTYPLTPPVKGRGGQITYRIGLVADLDTKSKVEKGDNTVWRSFLQKGYLTFTVPTQQLEVKWDPGDPIELESGFAAKGRGMELSELLTFNGKLLSFDDRTGIIYVIEKDKPIPWVILTDGNGHNQKGFKSEWATVKDNALFVGSMGKEWTTAVGEYENDNPMYVKKVLPGGEVSSIDWTANYKRMRQDAAQIKWPGYMIHESGVWSDVHKKWFFLPRRCSKDKYNETRDELMGCNMLIMANDLFTKIETIHLDDANTKPSHGFSSFKFVPCTKDQVIIAIKTEELNGQTSTFITAFDIDGKTLLPEQKIESSYKYEGIEFL